jgi:hypothetical protein
MEFRSRYHFRQLFHVCRFDVNDIEALVLDVQIPKVDAKIVTANKRFSIAIDRYAVDVVCMSIGVCPSWNSGHDSVVMCHARQFQ